MNGWERMIVVTKGAHGLPDCGKPPKAKSQRFRECCGIGIAQDFARVHEIEVDYDTVRVEHLDGPSRTLTRFMARRT